MFKDAKLFQFLKKWEKKLNFSLKLEAGECGYKLRSGNLGKFRGLNAINQKNIILFAVCVLFYFEKLFFLYREVLSAQSWLCVSILNVFVKKHLGKNEADERKAEVPWQWDPQKRVGTRTLQ